MSSHDTAALDADHAERSADVVTGGRDEPAELVLGRFEARMAESGLRAHICLTERTVVEFATRRKRTDRPLESNGGPEPVRRGAFSRGAAASGDGTAELAHEPARRRGRTESSAGADVVEQPGPGPVLSTIVMLTLRSCDISMAAASRLPVVL